MAMACLPQPDVRRRGGLSCLLVGLALDWIGVAASLAGGMFMLLGAVVYFERVERRFADLI
jgi:hypothetical protein